MMLLMVIVVIVVVMTARVMLLVMIVIIVVVMTALGGELLVYRGGASLVVAKEGVLDRSVAILHGGFDPFSEPLHFRSELLACGETDVRLRPRRTAGAGDAGCDDGERGAADKEDDAGAQEPDLKQ